MTTLLQHSQILEAKIKSLALAKSLADDLKHIQQRHQRALPSFSMKMGNTYF